MARLDPLDLVQLPGEVALEWGTEEDQPATEPDQQVARVAGGGGGHDVELGHRHLGAGPHHPVVVEVPRQRTGERGVPIDDDGPGARRGLAAALVRVRHRAHAWRCRSGFRWTPTIATTDTTVSVATTAAPTARGRPRTPATATASANGTTDPIR